MVNEVYVSNVLNAGSEGKTLFHFLLLSIKEER